MTILCKKKKTSATLNYRTSAYALTSKEYALNKSNLKQKHARSRTNRPFKHDGSSSKELFVKNKTIRVLLNSGLSGDLLFMKKGASKDIPVIKRAVPQSWGTSNGTFVTDKVGNIEIAFVDCSSSKKVHLAPAIVEYKPGLDSPMYDLIIGKNTIHDLGVVLDFNQSTIQIDKILLPMRDIANLRSSRALSEHFGIIRTMLRNQLAPAALLSV
jgi:hypothetical protein